MKKKKERKDKNKEAKENTAEDEEKHAKKERDDKVSLPSASGAPSLRSPIPRYDGLIFFSADQSCDGNEAG